MRYGLALAIGILAAWAANFGAEKQMTTENGELRTGKRKKFTVEVPCTTYDRYFIFANSAAECRGLLNLGSEMTEDLNTRPGDYRYDGPVDHAEDNTHWDRAVIVGEHDA